MRARRRHHRARVRAAARRKLRTTYLSDATIARLVPRVADNLAWCSCAACRSNPYYPSHAAEIADLDANEQIAEALTHD